MEIHIVNTGDTLQSIAAQYGVSAERVAYDNNIAGTDLVVGQALIIAIPETIYTIQNGDTIQSIAAAFGTTALQIVRNNSYLLNESFLLPGRQIVIRYTEMEQRNIKIFGYAYGFIRDDILEESCLYLDELLPFSYGYNMDGTLIPMNDDRLLVEATRFGLRKRMVITPLDVNERFNNQLVVMVLSDVAMRENLITNILQTMTDKGYQALDIDFEFIPGEFREAYVSFIAEVRARLAPQGYQVSVAVPPKIADDQPGLLYEGIDYAGIGNAADTVFLMTYEWGYKFGPPMAVAPIPSVRRVLDYAVSVIPREKLDMGIPNYAYDWPLPYERGVTEAETIGNVEAVRRAFQYGAQIQYDEQSQAPFFNYTLDGVEHVVWFEDVRSIAAKYDLITEYGFRGGGYWNLMREFRQNWMYVNLINSRL
ncbi:MAG: LysM peptidoglycan-binding domain-containing protein [Lachnospiraceae bacterium]|nr:LysM peptidoglycan-binding domain-containing protein [Lachnospiraceae bacterium]